MTIELDRFVLEGVTYYQQGRKCGREGCRCADGELHGPYWYSRELSSGHVKYLGRELPKAITHARATRVLYAPEIESTRRVLRDMLAAIERLQRNDELSNRDRAAIVVLGFGDTLVFQVGLPGEQDDDLGFGDTLVSQVGLPGEQDDDLVHTHAAIADMCAQDNGYLCTARLLHTQDL